MRIGVGVMPSNTGAAIEHLALWKQKGALPSALSFRVRSYPPEAELLEKSVRPA